MALHSLMSDASPAATGAIMCCESRADDAEWFALRVKQWDASQQRVKRDNGSSQNGQSQQLNVQSIMVWMCYNILWRPATYRRSRLSSVSVRSAQVQLSGQL